MTGLKVIDGTSTEISKYLREKDKIKMDLKLAKECIDYQLIKCHNGDCLNKSCPLNINLENENRKR